MMGAGLISSCQTVAALDQAGADCSVGPGGQAQGLIGFHKI